MLNTPYFYHGLLKKYVIAFGAIFSNIWIERTLKGTATDATSGVLDDGPIDAFFKVPLTYASKDKMLVRLFQDPNANPNQKSSAIDLPRMSFDYNIAGYDADRHLSKNNTIVGPASGASAYSTQKMSVPYNIEFNLYAYVKFTEDGQKIVEQILPHFAPDLTITVQLIPEMNITRKLPLTLDRVSISDQYEGDFKDRSIQIWTLTFTMRADLFAATEVRPLIKFVNVDVFVGESDTTSPAVLTSNTYPGLTANGTPTSNSVLTINPLLINLEDDWGVIQIFSEYIQPPPSGDDPVLG